MIQHNSERVIAHKTGYVSVDVHLPLRMHVCTRFLVLNHFLASRCACRFKIPAADLRISTTLEEPF